MQRRQHLSLSQKRKLTWAKWLFKNNYNIKKNWTKKKQSKKKQIKLHNLRKRLRKTQRKWLFWNKFNIKENKWQKKRKRKNLNKDNLRRKIKKMMIQKELTGTVLNSEQWELKIKRSSNEEWIKCMQEKTLVIKTD